MKHSNLDRLSLLLNDARGVYIPRNFAESFNWEDWHVSGDDAAILLQGPDTEWYLETWEHVLDTAYWVSSGDFGHMAGKWTLYQNGDLWAIHESMTEKEWEDFAS